MNKIVLVLFSLNLIWISILMLRVQTGIRNLNDNTKQILDITQESYLTGCFIGKSIKKDDETACKQQADEYVKDIKEILKNDN